MSESKDITEELMQMGILPATDNATTLIQFQMAVEDHAVLQKWAKDEGVTIEELIRRSLLLHKYLTTVAQDSEILIRPRGFRGLWKPTRRLIPVKSRP